MIFFLMILWQIQILFDWFALSCCLLSLGSLVVNYPYDDDKNGKTQYSQSPDDQIFQQVSRAYSQVREYHISQAEILSVCV